MQEGKAGIAVGRLGELGTSRDNSGLHGVFDNEKNRAISLDAIGIPV
jgi:hypothetical protein